MSYRSNKYFVIICFSFCCFFASSQKQLGITVQSGVSMIHYKYQQKPDTASQSVSIMYDVGLNYSVYINKNWSLYFLLNYGRFHGRQKFEYELYLPQWPNIQQHIGKLSGFTRWWFLNTALHPFVLYSKEKMGVNIGFRFVNSKLLGGRRHIKFYDLDGVLRNTSDEYNYDLSYNKLNFGPTLGFNYKITKNTFNVNNV